MDKLSSTQAISLIVPIAILQLLLLVIAIVLLVKAERTRGPKWLWAILIVCGGLLGSIAFFLFGRRSD